MILLIIYIIIICLFNVVIVSTQECSSRGYCGGTGNLCPNKNDTSTDGIHILDFNLELLININKAITIMEKYSGIITKGEVCSY